MIAAYVYALNLVIIYYTIQMGSETLSNFNFALFLGFLPSIFTLNSNNYKRLIILGVISGLLILNKSVFLVLLFLLPPLIWFVYKNKYYIKRSIFSLIIALLIMTPWSIRNYVVSRRFIPVQTLTGFNFWYDFTLDRNRDDILSQGNLFKTFYGAPVILPDGKEYKPYALDAKSDALYDSQLVSRAIKWCIHNPLKFLLKVVDNIFSFWYFTESPFKMLIAGFFSLLFLTLSVRGSFKLIKTNFREHTIFLIGIILLINLIYSPVLAVFRYSLTTYPLLSLLIAGNFISQKEF